MSSDALESLGKLIVIEEGARYGCQNMNGTVILVLGNTEDYFFVAKVPPTIRSVATGNQWSGLMNSRIF